MSRSHPPDLATLALFGRIAETRSITKAAAQSHLALAAASRRIAGLESRLGVKLLERSARGVDLTPAGAALLGHARLVLGQVNQLQAELAAYAQGGKGPVRIQANSSALAQFLPQQLAAFSAAFPDARIALLERRSASIVRALREGDTDVGIVMSETPIEGLACYDYRTDRLVAVVPRRHPLRGRSVSFARLLDFDLVGLESNTAMSQLLASRATAAGKPLRLRVQVNGFDVLAKLVQAGLGIGVLPELAARAFVRTLGLRLVPIADDWSRRRMLVCVRDRRTLPPLAARLVDHLLSPQSGA
jgi:DNA-binding transcriptional LysR family regulator